MERRVIKFNLMGAIGVLLLIIAAIVGITIFATNKNNSENKEKKNENQPQQQVQEDQESYNEVDTKEKVEIDGQDIEFIVEPFQSELNYTMNLASEKFYFEGNTEGKDVFKSLESDSILMEIYKVEGSYQEKAKDLIEGQKERIRNNETYRMNAVNFGEKLCYVDQEKKEDGFHFNYYIESEGSYYTIQVKCDEYFVGQLMPVVDKMVDSFKIM